MGRRVPIHLQAQLPTPLEAGGPHLSSSAAAGRRVGQSALRWRCVIRSRLPSPRGSGALLAIAEDVVGPDDNGQMDAVRVSAATSLLNTPGLEVGGVVDTCVRLPTCSNDGEAVTLDAGNLAPPSDREPRFPRKC